MYNSISKFLYFFLFFLINLKFVYSILLQDGEYICAYNIVSRVFGASQVGYINNTQTLDFCSNSNFVCNDGGFLISANFTQYGLEESLTSNLFSCFAIIETMTFNNFDLPSDFFNAINTRSSLKTLYLVNCNGFNIDSTFSYLTYLNMTFNNGPTYNIQMSYLINLKTFVITEINLNSAITFSNDLTTQSISFDNFIVVSNNLPNMTRVKCTTYNLKVGSSFDNSNIDQLGATYTLVSNILFFGNTFSWPFKNLQSTNNIISLTFTNPLNQASAIFSLASFVNLPTLTMTSVGSFAYGGLFPFNNFPNKLTKIQFQGGYLTVIPDYNMNKVSTLILSNNKIPSALPVFNRLSSNIKTLDLSYNQITGTIDYSYCYIDVNLNGNSGLNGALPTCMNCFPLIKANLGSSFTNLNDKCSTIVPNLKIDSTNKKLYLFGHDIGFSSNGTYKPFTISSAIGSSSWKTDVTNEQFTYTTYTSLPTLLNFTFPTNPTQTFILSTVKTSPIINSFIINSSNQNIQFLGSYYSYNSTLVSVTINSTSCSIVNSTFDQINCLYSSSLNTSKTNVITTVCIESLCTQITINLKGSGSLLTCSNPCVSPQYCNSQIGACTCQDGFQGSTCTTVYKQCPITNSLVCSGYGTCNNVTGVCTCNSGRTLSDCTGYQCPDPVCSNYGNCDTSTGKCSCDSSHQGSTCSTPFKQCPIFNSLVCSGYGTCNNQTGICTCDSTHQGSNCINAFVQCPIYNNQLCSSAGTCNNVTGVCSCNNGRLYSNCSGIQCSDPSCGGFGTCDTSLGICKCDSNHQGNNCGTTFKQCPIYNGQICSSAGTCNNVTGECSCNNGRTLSDCSGIQCSDPKCGGYGTCDTSLGVCKCDSSHQGPTCSLPFIQCSSYNNKICTGFGSCNNQTGVCTCDQSHQYSNCNTTFIQCPSSNDQICSGFGSCNNQTGVCTCDQYHQSNDCGQPLKNCPNDCSGLGTCNTFTGICKCDDVNSVSQSCQPIDCKFQNCNNHGTCNKSVGICECFSNYQNSNYQTDDCLLPYTPCLFECLTNASCYNVTGECNCPFEYQTYNLTNGCICKNNSYSGVECNIPNQYISSVQSTTIAGGQVILGGWFGTIHNNISITIGNDSCIILSESDITEYEIKCTISPNTGIKSINITQNNITWIGNDIYYFLPEVQTCQNNCNNGGDCIEGVCFCYSDYSGLYCGIRSSNNNNNTNNNNNNSNNNFPPTNNNINTTTGSIEISNEQDRYSITILSILELNIEGETVREYDLNNKWTFENSQNDSIYLFKQNLKDDNSNCTIFYTINEIINQNQNFTFANIKFQVPVGGLKLSLSIYNYSFLNSLNTLQLLINSSIGEDYNSDKNECNDQNTTIDSDSTELDSMQTMASIIISKNNKLFQGRFINRAIVDNERITIISTGIKEKTNNSILVSVNLPHSKNYYLDPDFSVLVKPEFQDSSSCIDDSKPSYLIPVAVVVPVVSVTALGVATVVLIKKHKIFFRISYNNIKLKTLNKFK